MKKILALCSMVTLALFVCVMTSSGVATAQCISIGSVTSNPNGPCQTTSSNCTTTGCSQCVDIVINNISNCCISAIGVGDNAANPNNCFLACRFGPRSKTTCDAANENMTNTANPLCPGNSTIITVCYVTSGTKVDIAVNCPGCGGSQIETVTLP